MNFNRVPHLIVSTNPKDPGFVAMPYRHWSVRARAADAFVFPSATLAERWASHMRDEYAGAFEIQAVPGHTSHVQGEPACCSCGCIDTFACPESCHWVAPGLCSACAEDVRVELQRELAARPDDPASVTGEAGYMAFGEAQSYRYEADAFNAEMERSGDLARAEDISTSIATAVMKVARQVEGGR